MPLASLFLSCLGISLQGQNAGSKINELGGVSRGQRRRDVSDGPRESQQEHVQLKGGSWWLGWWQVPEAGEADAAQ